MINWFNEFILLDKERRRHRVCSWRPPRSRLCKVKWPIGLQGVTCLQFRVTTLLPAWCLYLLLQFSKPFRLNFLWYLIDFVASAFSSSPTDLPSSFATCQTYCPDLPSSCATCQTYCASMCSFCWSHSQWLWSFLPRPLFLLSPLSRWL